MVSRTIGGGFESYRRASDGQWTFGMLGAEIDVHEDDVERFDRLHVVSVAGTEPESEDEDDASAGDGSGSDGDGDDSDDGGDGGDGDGDDGGDGDVSKPEPYEGVNVRDLKALLKQRNEGREDDAKVVPDAPGNRAEIVAALVADDAKQS